MAFCFLRTFSSSFTFGLVPPGLVTPLGLVTASSRGGRMSKARRFAGGDRSRGSVSRSRLIKGRS